MKLINILIILSFVFCVSNVSAKIYDRNQGRDIRLPSQHVLESITVEPDAAATNNVLNDNDGDTDGSGATVTTFLVAQDVPRALQITPVSTTADVKAGNVTVTGTNIFGETITENFAFLDNASTATTGTKAFKTVTSIAFPAEDSPYTAQWDVGFTDKIGLDHCMNYAGDVAWATADGVYEGTRPTCVADADEVEKNVCDPNTAANGSVDFTFYFIQNFRCN